MSNTTIQKGLIHQGTENIAVFREGDQVYRADATKTFTPISFYDIKSSQKKVLTLAGKIKKAYQIDLSTVDSVVDNVDPEKSIADARSEFQVLLGIQVSRSNGQEEHHFLNVSDGNKSDFRIFLQPDDVITINATQDVPSLTFWAVPVYIEEAIDVY